MEGGSILPKIPFFALIGPSELSSETSTSYEEAVDSFIKKMGLSKSIRFFEKSCNSHQFDMIDKTKLQILLNRFVSMIFENTLSARLARRVAIAAESRFKVSSEFIVEGEAIPFNRLLLITKPNFRTLLAGYFSESTKKSISIEGFTAKTMRLIVQCKNTLNISHFTKETMIPGIIDILKAADYFNLPELITSCQMHLIDLIDSQTIKINPLRKILSAAIELSDKRIIEKSLIKSKTHKYFSKIPQIYHPWVLTIPSITPIKKIHKLLSFPLYRFIDGFDLGLLALAIGDKEIKENSLTILKLMNAAEGIENKTFRITYEEPQLVNDLVFPEPTNEIPCFSKVKILIVKKAKNTAQLCALLRLLPSLQVAYLSLNLEIGISQVFEILKVKSHFKSLNLNCQYSINHSEGVLLNLKNVTDLPKTANVRKEITHVHLSTSTFISNYDLMNFFQTCSNLKTITATKVHWIDFNHILCTLSQSCKKLKEIHFEKCQLNSDSVNHLTKGCIELIKLNFGCSEIDNNALFAIAEHCSNLKSISLENCNKITDEGVIALVKGCSHLEEINLNKTSISEAAFFEIAANSKKLRQIEAEEVKISKDSILKILSQNNPIKMIVAEKIFERAKP